MFYRFLALAAAGILDQMFGDPRVRWHPICLIGNLISWMEQHTRGLFPHTKRGTRAAGVCLVIIVLLISTAVPLALVSGAYDLHPVAGVVVESILIYFTFAAKSLGRESMAVYEALNKDGLEAGRRAVSMIVGRDTAQLTETGVIKAAVETVAENTSDGVIAPVLYAALGGAPLVYFYKAVNTMDSMVGYKNERYEWYGTAAARLDDLVNLIPARLSALLMLLVCQPLKWYWQRRDDIACSPIAETWRIYRRDQHAHASPNSAQTESVMAGALGIQLAGNASYFGVIHEKPTIGDDHRVVQRQDIVRAVSLMRWTAYVGWGAALVLCAVSITI